MIPARSAFMTSRTIVQCPGAASGAGVQCGDIMNCVSLREGKITRTAVLLGEMWHPTNWSAGRVFICMAKSHGNTFCPVANVFFFFPTAEHVGIVHPS